MAYQGRMRSVVPALALTLLVSTAAVAQVSISDEVLSDPLQDHVAPLLFSQPMPVPAVSLAKDGAGVAIAWTMANAQREERVYVTRLDGAGHAAGGVREIPLGVPASMHQVYPSLAAAPGGSGFVLAWMEIDRLAPSWRRVFFCGLDSSLQPSAATLLYPGAIANGPPIVRTNGDTTWIAGGGVLASLAKDGTLSSPIPNVAPSDMALPANLPLLVGGTNVKTGVTCAPECAGAGGPFNCWCFIDVYSYSLSFTSLLTTSQVKTYPFKSDAAPAVESNGRDALVAWFRGPATGGDVVTLRMTPAEFSRFDGLAAAAPSLALFPPDPGVTRPSIATDGQRYVVVWRVRTAPGNHDIAGMAIDADGGLTPLSIATSAADEIDPAILYLGGGTFLVGYEKDTLALERRIAGRFVTFPSGRRRPAR